MPPRRSHTYSRLTTAIAVLALATAVYSLVRLDATRDRLEEIGATVRALDTERNYLRTELEYVAERAAQEREALEGRLAALEEVPAQMQELTSVIEELRGRTVGPERAWSRAEAMYLLELAQRRLALNRDIETAIAALEGADARLAALKDASFAPVRQQIARELQALRAVQAPDVVGIGARLTTLEEGVHRLPVRGIVVAERTSAPREALPEAFLARAWTIARNAVADLIRVRVVDERAGGIITQEEALLRREHLRLLLFSARTAVSRHDAQAYRHALASARTLLEQAFDTSQPSTQSALAEIRMLEPLDIAPPLPELTGSVAALRRLIPSGQTNIPAQPE